MPDIWFDFLAATEPAATRGTVLRAIPQFPDARDPNQSLRWTRVARFGLKDQQTNLVSFLAARNRFAAMSSISQSFLIRFVTSI
jgi:hypothetical protein